MLVREVLAAAAHGLGAVQGHKVEGLARAALHSAGHADGALLGKHLVVCFVLFIPKSGKVITFITLLVFIRKLPKTTYYSLHKFCFEVALIALFTLNCEYLLFFKFKSNLL